MFAVLLSVCLLLLSLSHAQALTCIFTWSAPTTNADGSNLTDLAAYTLYASTTSGQYPATPAARVDAPALTVTAPCTLNQFWVVRAVDSAGNESGSSNEVQVRDTVAPGPPGNLTVTTTTTTTTTSITVVPAGPATQRQQRK